MQLLASLQDTNTYLPPNVQISNAVDNGLQVDAQRLIRGQLVTTFSTDAIQSWDTPDHTPELIRSIAGMLIASRYYSKLISQDSADDVPNYALDLYQKAIAMLAQIRAGTLIVVDGNGVPIPGNDTGSNPQGDVFPNDADTSGPKFTMSRVLTST